MDNANQVSLENLFRTTPLKDYFHLCAPSMTITVEITQEEIAAILQAYDYGIENATEDALKQLNSVMNKFKEQIHP